jgi:hypothetical protein
VSGVGNLRRDAASHRTCANYGYFSKDWLIHHTDFPNIWSD